MKICIISNNQYRACTPDQPDCLSYYGSEPQHAILAEQLGKNGHDVHFIAPTGSFQGQNVTLHPTSFTGGLLARDLIEEISLERPKFTHKSLMEMDFIIDMSALANNIEQLARFTSYRKYCCYRNGYLSFGTPAVGPQLAHLVTPSKQNTKIFADHGYAADTIYYGIPPFYCPGDNAADYFTDWFGSGFELTEGDYWLFPHRMDDDKGTDIVLQLAERFTRETFVFSAHAPLGVHQVHENILKSYVAQKGLENVRFVTIPLTHEHHYFKRELLRHAKAVLSPFHYPKYVEGFGLANAEAVQCGTPLIISDSPSTTELWREYTDAIICEPTIRSFEGAIWHFGSYNLHPSGRFSVEDYARNYEQLALKYA